MRTQQEYKLGTQGAVNVSRVLRAFDPVATEAVKKSLDQSITQVTEIRRLGRGQSIGSGAINSTRPRLNFECHGLYVSLEPLPLTALQLNG